MLSLPLSFDPDLLRGRNLFCQWMRERSFSDIVSTLEKIAQWKRFQNNS